MTDHERLIVLDFGSQVTQLIARRAREDGVLAEVHPYDVDLETLRALKPKGIILSGGPSSIYDEGAPKVDPRVLDLGVPEQRAVLEKLAERARTDGVLGDNFVAPTLDGVPLLTRGEGVYLYDADGKQYCWYQATVKGGREARDIDAVQLARACEELGAGELHYSPTELGLSIGIRRKIIKGLEAKSNAAKKAAEK